MMTVTQYINNDTYTICNTSSSDQHIYAELCKKPNIVKNTCPFLKPTWIKIGLCVIAIVTTAVLSSGITFAVLYSNCNFNSEGKHLCSAVNVSQSNENYELNIQGNRNCTQSYDRTVSKLDFLVNYDGTRCPDGWHTNGKACYLILHKKKTWFQARDFCRSHRSDLISLHGKTEVDSLPIDQLKAESYWTGLNELHHKGQFRWSDWTPLGYVNWNSYEPNHWNNFEHCVEMSRANRKWNDANCYVTQSFICKLSLTDKCGNGNWYLHNGSCYLFKPSDGYYPSLSWAAARYACLQKGADLISIGSDHELSFVLSQAFQISTSVKWIGLNNFAGKYKWLDRTVSGNLTWGREQPDNAQHHCVYLGRLGNIYDADCATMNEYVCEKVL